MFDAFRRFRKNQRGNVGIIFALAAVPAFALMGGIVDYANIQDERHKLQAALDAGVLAALKEGIRDEQRAKDRVWQYLQTNYKASPRVQYDRAGLAITIGTPRDPNASVMTADMSVEIRTSFLGLLGIGSMSMQISSQAVKGNKTVEVVLVLDASYSMTCNASGFDPSVDEETYTKRVQAREAVADFIDRLKSKLDETPGVRMKLGVVPYSTYVRLPHVRGGAVPDWVQLSGVTSSSWKGYLGPRNPADELDAIDGDYDTYPVPGVAPKYKEDATTVYEIGDPLPSIKPLKDLSIQANVDELRNHVRGMISEGPAYIPSGIAWGWRVLSSRAPYDEGESDNVRKVMIVLAGGSNLCEYDHDGLMKCYGAADTANADARMEAVCNAAKQHGIEIIGISFYPKSYENLPTILGNCQNAGFHTAGNKAQLKNVLDQIAEEIVRPGGRQLYLSH